MHEHMPMMLKVLKTLPRDDLDLLARARGIDRPHRLDIEYSLLAIDEQAALVRVVSLMVFRALRREVDPKGGQVMPIGRRGSDR